MKLLGLYKEIINESIPTHESGNDIRGDDKHVNAGLDDLDYYLTQKSHRSSGLSWFEIKLRVTVNMVMVNLSRGQTSELPKHIDEIIEIINSPYMKAIQYENVDLLSYLDSAREHLSKYKMRAGI